MILILVLLLITGCGCGFGRNNAPDKINKYRAGEITLEINRARDNLILFNNTFSFSKTKFVNGNSRLFEGLLCSSGEQRSCDVIKDMQDKYDFMCRSWEHCLKGDTLLNASSRDEFLGELLFWTTTKYYNNVPDNNYINNGKICKNASDRRCSVNIYQNRAFYSILHKLGRISTSAPYAQLYTLLQAKKAPTGYKLHLQAVMVYLYQLNNICEELCIEAAKILIKRQPQNEFYQYLAGYHKKATDIFLEHTKYLTYVKQGQWWSQRSSSEEAWLSGNAANTIFLGNLLSK